MPGFSEGFRPPSVPAHGRPGAPAPEAAPGTGGQVWGRPSGKPCQAWRQVGTARSCRGASPPPPPPPGTPWGARRVAGRLRGCPWRRSRPRPLSAQAGRRGRVPAPQGARPRLREPCLLQATPFPLSTAGGAGPRNAQPGRRASLLPAGRGPPHSHRQCAEGAVPPRFHPPHPPRCVPAGIPGGPTGAFFAGDRLFLKGKRSLCVAWLGHRQHSRAGSPRSPVWAAPHADSLVP